MLQEIRDLHRIRLDDDLSYRELGEMLGMSERGVRLLLTLPKPKPWERTLHKVRRFLATYKPKAQPVGSR